MRGVPTFTHHELAVSVRETCKKKTKSDCTFLVEHNGQDGDPISRGNLVNATRHTEQENTIANDGTDKLRTFLCIRRHFNCSTNTPTQSCTATVNSAA